MNRLGKSIYWSRLLAFLLTPLALTLFVPSSAAQGTPGKPNIIIILADDLGYGDVRFNGCPDYLTPNIDSLTTNGVRCSNGYVTHPFCSPSRAALLTGRYQQRFGHENQPEQDDNNTILGLPSGELLLTTDVETSRLRLRGDREMAFRYCAEPSSDAAGL
jgi:Sulfatase